MTHGSCLCGGVRFEVDRAVGPFELCHCNRCRKVSGSAFAAMIGVMARDFRLVAGEDLIESYDAPILRSPPPYRVYFCRRCGSTVPFAEPGAEWFEVPAGLLEGDPVLPPDKHIFVELKAPWYRIEDSLPQFTAKQLRQLRASQPRVPREDEGDT